LCQRLSEVVAAARAVVSALDPGGMPAAQAASAFEAFAELERLAGAGKLLVAPKVNESSSWVEAGHHSAEEWMARTAGVSIAETKKLSETAERVAGLPATAEALRAGELSLAQAGAVAEAAAVSPGAEAELLEAAATESMRTLKERSRKAVLDSRGSVEQRYARQRRLRSFTHWIDDEGMVAGRFRLSPDLGSAVVKAVEREADRHYRRAYRQGRRESPENYAADALVGLVTGEGLIGSKTGSKGAEMIVLVSHGALQRGFVEPGSDELCEVAGFGAVPVSRAREVLADCFLKAVVVDGTRVTHVKHFGRHRPAEVDTALLGGGHLAHGAIKCSVEGCDRTVGIEWDHQVPFARGGPTSVENLDPKCRHHHRIKTRAGPGPP
jgi:hypothetical protein